jgi:ELWxxDGT repeat protein
MTHPNALVVLASVAFAHATLAATPPASVGSPYLVKDINTVARALDSDPAPIAVAGDTLYFSAKDVAYGVELWRTDGTPQGTSFVRDIAPGPASSNPSEGVAFKSQLYFRASTPESGDEMWKSDGTALGTTMQPETNAGSSSSSPSQLLATSSRLFYTSNVGAGVVFYSSNGGVAGGSPVSGYNDAVRALAPGKDPWILAFGQAGTWRTDGTQSGTFKLTSATIPHEQAVDARTVTIGDAVLFFANDNLYRTDGSVAGTSVIKSFNASSAYAHYLTLAGGVAYFYGRETTSGTLGLWKSDGTANGTVLVKGVAAGTITAFGSKVIFTAVSDAANRRLWVSDGTADGTIVLSMAGTVEDTVSLTSSGVRVRLALAGGSMYVPMTINNIPQLWRTDGTPAGTQSISTMRIDPTSLTAINNRVFFSATEIVFGKQPWVSNGTSSGTQRLQLINGTDDTSAPAALTPFGGQLYFFASANGRDVALWSTRGTDSTTTLVKIVGDTLFGSAPTSFGECGGLLYFSAYGGANASLWRSDGTEGGTAIVAANPAGGAACSANGLVFGASNGFNYDLRVTNGSAGSNTTLASYTSLTNITRSGSRVVYYGDGIRGTDGTAGGTQSLPVTLTNIGRFVAAPAIAYIFSSNGTSYALWRSDGTPAGTFLLHSFSASAAPLNVIGDTLYFNASENGMFASWQTDGTVAGTKTIGALLNAPLVSYKNALYFFDNSGSLDRTDGTAQGTMAVVNPLPLNLSTPRDLTVARDWMFFAADYRNSSAGDYRGVELWVSDGTNGGTHLVADIAAGADRSDPANFTLVGTTLYFTATTRFGTELWALPLGGSRVTRAARH